MAAQIHTNQQNCGLKISGINQKPEQNKNITQNTLKTPIKLAK